MKCVGGRVEFMMRRRSQTGRNGWKKGEVECWTAKPMVAERGRSNNNTTARFNRPPQKKADHPHPQLPEGKTQVKYVKIRIFPLPRSACLCMGLFLSFLYRERGKGRGKKLLFISTFFDTLKARSDRLVCEYFRLKKFRSFT